MKKITLTTITLFAALLLVACGSDKKKGGTARSGNNNTNIGQACTGCSDSDRLYSAMGRTGTGVELTMEFFAANPGVETGLTPGFSGGYYTGPVDGIGRLYIATGLSCGYNAGVAAPAGIYDVQVRGLGYISGSGLVKGIEAVAVGGGYEIYMRLKEASFLNSSPLMRSCDGYDYNTEMNARWEITFINGQPCGNTILFGGNSLGGTSSCL